MPSEAEDAPIVAPSSEAPYLDFVRAQTPALLRLARAMSGSQHDAWDLTQETLVRVGARWSRIAEPAAYARTVMTRLNIDRLRRLRREAPGWFGGPEQAAEEAPSGDAEAWLEEALATLPPRQRTALALRYVDDLDVAGVAERMGCSVGTAKSHLSRGTERLRTWARDHGHVRHTDTDSDPDSDRSDR